jgi:hypothetical protein
MVAVAVSSLSAEARIPRSRHRSEASPAGPSLPQGGGGPRLGGAAGGPTKDSTCALPRRRRRGTDPGANGWQMTTSTQLTITGTACAAYRSSPTPVIDVSFPCTALL